MELTCKSWGNSLAFRIPSNVAKSLNLEDGAKMELKQKGKTIVLTPIEKPPRYTLAELLEGITEENKHGETLTGPVVGNEEW